MVAAGRRVARLRASDFASLGETRFRIDLIRQSPMPAILEIYHEILLRGEEEEEEEEEEEPRLRRRERQIGIAFRLRRGRSNRKIINGRLSLLRMQLSSCELPFGQSTATKR